MSLVELRSTVGVRQVEGLVDDEVKRDGRSAVLRRAADLYLRQRKARDVAAAYRRAYGDQQGLGAEFDGWEDEGAWPVE